MSCACTANAMSIVEIHRILNAGTRSATNRPGWASTGADASTIEAHRTPHATGATSARLLRHGRSPLGRAGFHVFLDDGEGLLQLSGGAELDDLRAGVEIRQVSRAHVVS